MDRTKPQTSSTRSANKRPCLVLMWRGNIQAPDQPTNHLERFKPLMEANAVSKQDYINAVAAQKTAEADVAAARAAVTRMGGPFTSNGPPDPLTCGDEPAWPARR